MKKVILFAGSLMAFATGFAARQQPQISVQLKNHSSDTIVVITRVKADSVDHIKRIKCAPRLGFGSLLVFGELPKLLPSVLKKNARLSSLGLVDPQKQSKVMINNCFYEESHKQKQHVNILNSPGKLHFSLFVGVSRVPFKIKNLSNVQFAKAPDSSTLTNNLMQPTSPDQLTWYEKKLTPADNGTVIHFYHPEKQKEQFDRQGGFTKAATGQ